MTAPAVPLVAVAWMVLIRLGRARRARRLPCPGNRGESAPDAQVQPTAPRSLRLIRHRRWVIVIGGALTGTLVAGPVLGAGVAAVPLFFRWRGDRREGRQAELAVTDQVPEAIDLLALALGAGLSITESMAAVGHWAPGPVGDALAEAERAVRRGEFVGDALETARDRCGAAAAGLFSALIAADRYGTPLDAPLDRLGHQARLDRRRAAEERARKVPVRLLFPLVVCVLPAFGLLTVVPLLVNSLGALT